MLDLLLGSECTSDCFSVFVFEFSVLIYFNSLTIWLLCFAWTEETELFIHLHLGEGELEDVIEEKFHLLHPDNCIAKEDLSSALNNLSKAANLSKKHKDKQVTQ